MSDKPNENEPNSDISPPVRRAHTQNTEQISTTHVWKMALDAKNKTKKQAYYSSSEYNLMRILALVSGNYGKALMSTQGFRVWCQIGLDLIKGNCWASVEVHY